MQLSLAEEMINVLPSSLIVIEDVVTNIVYPLVIYRISS